MSKDTTTTTGEESVQALEVTQPEISETQAVQEVENTSDNNNQADETNEVDNSEILEWASKKGIKTDDPISVLKMVRESETKMHLATQEAKKLREAVSTVGENEGYDEGVKLLNRLKVTDFYNSNPDAKGLDAEMAQIITEKPYLAEDLESVYEMASFRANKQASQIDSETSRKNKLAATAKAEIAAPPKTSATTRETVKTITDEDIANMTAAEYLEFKKTTGFDPFATA